MGAAAICRHQQFLTSNLLQVCSECCSARRLSWAHAACLISCVVDWLHAHPVSQPWGATRPEAILCLHICSLSTCTKGR
jgi:hypothetical protein